MIKMNQMKQLELSTWKKVNNSFRKRLIYHAGIDCGFFKTVNISSPLLITTHN